MESALDKHVLNEVSTTTGEMRSYPVRKWISPGDCRGWFFYKAQELTIRQLFLL